MNRASFSGRLTADPEVRYSTGEKPIAVATYTLAVDRPGAKEPAQTVDFIPCKAFGKNAEFAEKYLRKGMKIIVCGKLCADKYVNKEGQNRTNYVVLVNEHEFCERKADTMDASAPQMDFKPLDEADEGLPFVL